MQKSCWVLSNSLQLDNKIPPSWAAHHSDKLPIKGVYSRHSALKMLEIHKVFLRFWPCMTEISALYRCYAVLKW